MPGPWRQVSVWGNAGEHEIHVEPLGDLIIHNYRDCPCCPRIEWESAKRIIVHHAWDQREKTEDLN